MQKGETETYRPEKKKEVDKYAHSRDDIDMLYCVKKKKRKTIGQYWGLEKMQKFKDSNNIRKRIKRVIMAANNSDNNLRIKKKAAIKKIMENKKGKKILNEDSARDTLSKVKMQWPGHD